MMIALRTLPTDSGPAKSAILAFARYKTVSHGASGLSRETSKVSFDNIDHNTLIAILRKRIKDEKILRLIRKVLKCRIYGR